MSGGAVLCAATGYAWEVGYGLLWWAGLYWPLVLAVWLLVLLGLTAARAARAAVRSAKAT
jgi:hypothetical protein